MLRAPRDPSHPSMLPSTARLAQNLTLTSHCGSNLEFSGRFCMRCPHCGLGIHESLAGSLVYNYPQVTSLDGKVQAPPIFWSSLHQRYPECYETIIYLQQTAGGTTIPKRFMAYPASPSRPVPPEVTDRTNKISRRHVKCSRIVPKQAPRSADVACRRS